MKEKALKNRYFPLLIVILLLGSCEDGIRFPWSEDPGHEAEVTADTSGSETDTSMAVAETDTLATPEPDSLWTEPAGNRGFEESPEEISATQVKQWRVVVSSMPSEELARRFIERHGIETADVVYVDRLDTYRVVYASFNELSDAQTEFSLIRADHPDAWLVYF
jgi:hypothetical protein